MASNPMQQFTVHKIGPEIKIAGVDLLESERGALVLEVNSSPGLEGIEKASQVNVAGAVSERLNKLLQKIQGNRFSLGTNYQSNNVDEKYGVDY